MGVAERQAAYGCDITYVTAKEAGFDLLRSHLASEPEHIVHRPFHLAIVDEADSILIDEARVPLVIAGVLGSPEETPYGLAELVDRLDPDEHFATDEYSRNIELTAVGIDRVEELLDCGNLLAAENLALLTGINCALHAKVLLRRDVDYIVRDGRIQLVDEFTGRVVEDRHWPDGLQAALEAKEGLKLRPEGRVLGSITLQHFVRLYPRLAGMTATASPAAEELTRTYGIEVVVIPQNRPSIRIDHADEVFTHRAAKHRALVEEIETSPRHRQTDPRGYGERQGVRGAGRSAAAIRHRDPDSQRQERRDGGRHHRRGGRSGCGDDLHQHGRPGHRHPSRWSRRRQS